MYKTVGKALNSVIILVCVTCLAVVGCSSIVDRVIPTDVNPRSASYAGYADKDLYSLYDAKVIKDEIAIVHRDTQMELLRQTEDDVFAFQTARSFIEAAIEASEDFKEKVIGNDANPLSVSGFLFALTGGLIGRSFFRRPGDLTPDEARAKGATV